MSSNTTITEKTIANPKTHYGSGKASTWRFIAQRATAVLNVVFTVFLIWLVVRLAGADVEAMGDLLSNPVVCVVVGLMIISAAIHMEIGMREVLDDYVHGEAALKLSLMLNTLVCAVVALAALAALIKLAFWG
jgi:succinate dehydrogenase / fumarate reductase, membrane anchor subunit